MGGVAIFFLLAGVYTILTALIILMARQRAGLAQRCSYALLALLAPAAILLVGTLLPAQLPNGLAAAMPVSFLLSPYLVRAIFVFRHPLRSE